MYSVDELEDIPEVFLCACIIDIHVTVRTDDGNRLAVYPYSCKPEDQPAGGTDQTGNPKPAGLWKQQQGTCDTDYIWQEKREKPDFSYGASLF